MKYIFLMTISFAFYNCASTQNQSTNDGSSMEKALKVKSIEQEYKIASEKCSDCKMKNQRLIFNDKDKPFDVLTYIKPNGEEVKYYFDISSFYGNF